MSRLTSVLEAFNGVDTIENLIKSCEDTMKFTTEALKADKDSKELVAIHNSAKQDKELLNEYYKRLKKEYDELLERAKSDRSFMLELEATTQVSDEFKKALEALKVHLLTPQGYEKPEE